MNVSIKFPKEIKSPWRALYYAEQFIRNEWTISMVNSRISDLFMRIHNPTDLWYNQMRRVQGYPIPADVKKISNNLT